MQATPEPEEVAQSAQEWANDLHRDMLAATLLDPSLICFRSVALDEPESVIRAKLVNEMIDNFKPKAIVDLRSFLPMPGVNTVK